MSYILDTDGFNPDYYIRVQRNMIEAGIRDKSQYADLYIYEITTDPTMQTLCDCCSDKEGDGKKQYIKWRFHVRSRKDPNFEMIIGSTCITQFKDIDPDELKYALLLFHQERKRVERKRREDARKARVEQYGQKYKDYIEYLKKYQELRHYLPADLYDIYKILLEGRKIFREHHEKVLQDYMDKLPVRDIEQQLDERRRRIEERRRQAMEWEQERLAAASRRMAERIKQQTEQVQRLLVKFPDNPTLLGMLQQLQQDRELNHSQLQLLEDFEDRMKEKDELQQKMEEYLEKYDNKFMREMLQLLKNDKHLTEAQIAAIERIFNQLQSFLQRYNQQLCQLFELEQTLLDTESRQQFESLKKTFFKAAGYGHFYNRYAEQQFMQQLQKFYDKHMAPTAPTAN